jgi:hypothetical protein
MKECKHDNTEFNDHYQPPIVTCVDCGIVQDATDYNWKERKFDESKFDLRWFED